jgi:Domain of Unknown Function (DUF928)
LSGLAQGVSQKQPVAKITATSRLNFAYPKKPNLHSAGGKRGSKSYGVRAVCDRTLALIPGLNLGVTAAAEPIMWFYGENLLELQFSLIDSSNPERPLWKHQVPKSSGIVGIKIPKGNIAEGKRYQWKFDYKCPNPNGGIMVGETLSGAIYRFSNADADTLQRQLVGATPQQRLDIYARNGVWQELLSELLVLRRQEPNNLLWLENWRSLWASPVVKFERESESVPGAWVDDRDLIDLITKSPISSLP